MKHTDKVRIFKYMLPTVPGKFTIKFDPPLKSRFWFKEQKGCPVLYAEVGGEDAHILEADFIAVMTGQVLEDVDVTDGCHDYIGTAMLHGGDFVLHYYIDWARMYERWEEIDPDEDSDTAKDKIECVTTPQ